MASLGIMKQVVSHVIITTRISGGHAEMFLVFDGVLGMQK